MPYLVSVEYVDVNREYVAPGSVAGQDTDDIEDLMKLCGPLGKFQDVPLSGVGFPLLALRAKSEATHRVAGRESVQTPLMIQSVVVEVV